MTNLTPFIITLIFLGFLGMLLSFIPTISQEPYYEEIKCFDNFNNEIIGEVCIDELTQQEVNEVNKIDVMIFIFGFVMVAIGLILIIVSMLVERDYERERL